MSDLVHRKCAGAAAALTGAVLIAGCSTPSTTSAPGQSTSSAVPRTAAAAAPTTTAVPLPSPPAPVPTNSPAVPQPGAGGSAPAQCQTSGLVITAGPAAGALEHGGAVVVFTNAGPTCTMTAYPGVNGVDGQQGTIARARRALRGTLGGVPPTEAHPRMVTLRRGQRASALLEGLNARTTGAPCPTYAGLLVTPPDNTAHTFVPLQLSLCDPVTHPVVAGTTGGEQERSTG